MPCIVQLVECHTVVLSINVLFFEAMDVLPVSCIDVMCLIKDGVEL